MPPIEVGRSFTAHDVMGVLQYLFAVRGTPEHIRSYNWSAPLTRMRVLYAGSHKEIIDDQKAKTTKA